MLNKTLKFIIFTIMIIFPIVTVHELGHLLSGILFGLNPTNFSIGFGPELLSFKTNNLVWSIRTIPLGGFVSFPPMDSINHYHWLITLIAGPLFNFVFAFFIFLFFIKKVKRNISFYKLTTTEDSLLAIDVSFINQRKYLIFNEKNLSFNSVNEIPISFQKENNIDSLKFSLALAFPFFFKISKKYLLIIKSFKSSYAENRNFLGPIAIIKKGIKEYEENSLSFLLYIGELSVGIGFLNLLPLPFLDGSKIWLVLSQSVSNISLFIALLVIFMIFSRK